MNKRFYFIKKRFWGRIYGMGEWHYSNYFERPYCKDVINITNLYMERMESSHETGAVVEVGCGTGDIIGNIKWPLKYGFDINDGNRKVAQKLYPRTIFSNGSFGEINCRDLCCLIMVNFIHEIPPEDLKDMLTTIIECGVEMVVLDTFRGNKGTEYTYAHDGNFLLQEKFKLDRRSKGFRTNSGARRYIEWWIRK